MKHTYIVVGYIKNTGKIVLLYENNIYNNAYEYKQKYESRISIYESFEIMEETYPSKFNSYMDYYLNKYKINTI